MIEASLLGARIPIVGGYDAPLLYLNVGTVGSAFGVQLQFVKDVIDPHVGDTTATTWESVSIGIGVQDGDAGYIVSAAREKMDEFVATYLYTNLEFCDFPPRTNASPTD